MAISERLLKKWRLEALEGISPESKTMPKQLINSQRHILQMTQELLDQHLLRKIKGGD